MSIRFITSLVVLVMTATLAAERASIEADLPGGSLVQIRLMDYVNTEHQPLGYTFRGVVEGNVTAANKIVVPDKSRVLMRLVSDPGTAGGLTVEWWAVKFGEDWSEFRSSEGAGLFTILKNVEDRRAPKSDSKPLIYRGSTLHVPFSSILHFEVRRPVRLLNVGRFRF